MTQEENTAKKPKHSRENIRITFNMAWPSIVESFFAAFAGLVDSLMVSSLGSYAVAAVGLTTQPKFLCAECCDLGADCAQKRGEESKGGQPASCNCDSFSARCCGLYECSVCGPGRSDYTALRLHAGDPRQCGGLFSDYHGRHDL